jgi:hypothetical protein
MNLHHRSLEGHLTKVNFRGNLASGWDYFVDAACDRRVEFVDRIGAGDSLDGDY